MNDWVVINRENYPKDRESVQVTYLGYNDGLPYCNAFAYRLDNEWLWSTNDREVQVDIVAWKKCCEPYKGK